MNQGLDPVSNGNVRGFGRLAVLCVVFAAAATQLHAASFDEATEHYRRFMIADMDRALAGAQILRDCINANDIPGAKKAWIDARIGWERSEVFTSGFIPELGSTTRSMPGRTPSQAFTGWRSSCSVAIRAA